MKVEELSVSEIKSATDKLFELVESQKENLDAKEYDNMKIIVSDARDNFIYRVEYPLLTDQCFKCKYHQYLIAGFTWCCTNKNVQHTSLNCKYFEEGENVFENSVVSIAASEDFDYEKSVITATTNNDLTK